MQNLRGEKQICFKRLQFTKYMRKNFTLVECMEVFMECINKKLNQVFSSKSDKNRERINGK